MHYYKRNIGDYHKKAGRLSILQHGIYMLLIDACYDREKFPTKDQAIDWVWASSKEEIEAVDFVLSKFFTLEKDEYIQQRIKEELSEYADFCVKQTEKGKLGGRPRNKANVTHRKPNGLNNKPNESLTTNQEPLTTNQEPLTTNQEPLTTNHKKDLCSADAKRVFDYWQSVMEKDNYKLTPSRQKKIESRLKSYSVDSLKSAIDGCRFSEFHMGKNDQKTEYNDIGFILRNDEKVDFFMSKASGSSQVNAELNDWINNKDPNNDAIEGEFTHDG